MSDLDSEDSEAEVMDMKAYRRGDKFSKKRKSRISRRRTALDAPFRKTRSAKKTDQAIVRASQRYLYLAAEARRELIDRYTDVQVEAMSQEQRFDYHLAIMNTTTCFLLLEPIDLTNPIFQFPETQKVILQSIRQSYSFDPTTVSPTILRQCHNEDLGKSEHDKYNSNYMRCIEVGEQEAALTNNESYSRSYPGDVAHAELSRAEIKRQPANVPLIIPRFGQSFESTPAEREEHDKRPGATRTRYLNASEGKVVKVYELMQLRQPYEKMSDWKTDRRYGDVELALQAGAGYAVTADSKTGGFLARWILSSKQVALRKVVEAFLEAEDPLEAFNDLVSQQTSSISTLPIDPARTTESVAAAIKASCIDSAKDFAKREAEGALEAYHQKYDHQNPRIAPMLAAPHPRTIPSPEVVNRLGNQASSISELNPDQSVPCLLNAKDNTLRGLAGEEFVYAEVAGEGPASMAYTMRTSRLQPNEPQDLIAIDSDSHTISTYFIAFIDLWFFTLWHILILVAVMHNSRILYHARPRLNVIESSKVAHAFSLGMYGSWSAGATQELLDEFLDGNNSDRIDELLVLIILVIVVGPNIFIIVIWKDLPCKEWSSCVGRPTVIEYAPRLFCIGLPKYHNGAGKRRPEAFLLIRHADFLAYQTQDMIVKLSNLIPCGPDKKSQSAFLVICEAVLEELGITAEFEALRIQLIELDDALWRLRITSSNDRERETLGVELAEERMLKKALKVSQGHAGSVVLPSFRISLKLLIDLPHRKRK